MKRGEAERGQFGIVSSELVDVGKKHMLRWGIWLGPIVCLLIALGDMPYGYYQILRVILFCASGYLAIAEGKRNNGFWLWAFIACALIYNPVATLSLGKEIWTIVNVLTIGLFGSHFWARKNMVLS